MTTTYQMRAVYRRVVSAWQDDADGPWYERLECGHVITAPYRQAKGRGCVQCSKILSKSKHRDSIEGPE